MNAYDLANILNECIDNKLTDLYCVCYAAKMLRQQADRIAELENQLDKCSHHQVIAHQGGYEIGYAEGLKKASKK